MDPRILEALGTGGCVVDLGCGSGQLLNDVAGRFERRIGLDISRRRLDAIPGDTLDWDFRLADLNQRFPLEDGIADAVIANQVIEHIIDPVGFAQEIHRVLRHGERCVITTPNIRYLKNIAHLLFSGYGPRTAGDNTMDGAWDDGHLHYLTHRDLRELFTGIRFYSVESAALIANVEHGWTIRRLLDRWRSTWPVREFLSGCILLRAVK